MNYQFINNDSLQKNISDRLRELRNNIINIIIGDKVKRIALEQNSQDENCLW